MRYDWSDGSAPTPARVIDLVAEEDIPYVRWCDDETGEYERALTDERGAFFTTRAHGQLRIATARGRTHLKVELPSETQGPASLYPASVTP